MALITKGHLYSTGTFNKGWALNRRKMLCFVKWLFMSCLIISCFNDNHQQYKITRIWLANSASEEYWLIASQCSWSLKMHFAELQFSLPCGMLLTHVMGWFPVYIFNASSLKVKCNEMVTFSSKCWRCKKVCLIVLSGLLE